MTATLLEQQGLFQQYLRETPVPLSGYSFVNIFAWQDFFSFEFEIIEGSLCIFARHEAGVFLYLPPLGKDVRVETLRACFKRMEEVNRGNRVSRVENVCAQQLPLFPEDEFSHYHKGYEYCYYRQDIAALKGNPYKSKRSSCNQFIKNHTFQYLPYDDAMLSACVALYQEWAQDRRRAYADNAVALAMLEENTGVHQLVLRYHKELGLVGRVVTVEGEIKAYTVGYPLNEKIFCVLFEVADLSLNGLGAFIFREFCRDAALAPYPFINVMDDFELHNIQRTKNSFHPAVLLPSYVVTRKQGR